MKELLTIQESCNGISEAMGRLQYSPRTIEGFQLDCRRFRNYAVQKTGTDLLTDEICADYLQNCVGYPFVGEDRPLTTKEAALIRCIRRLLEYQQYGTLFGVKKRSSVSIDAWAAEDTHYVSAYIEAMQTADNSEATKKMRNSHVRKFYQFLSSRELNGIGEVSPGVIRDFCCSLTNYSPVFARHILCTVRNYFRFLYRTGYSSYDWSEAVPRMTVPSNLNVPQLWGREDIVKLLRSIDRGNLAGKRDYAIILLVAQLGLRVSDVANLQLENLKWERSELVMVQHKTGNRTVYPLLKDVGWAIAEYLKERISANISSPYVFVKNNAPYGPMLSSSIGCILDRCMKRAGIHKQRGVTSGMHSLRHALACRLLAQNTSLYMVADIMGHSSYASSSPYLKVDIEGMRRCALSLGEV